MDKPVIFKLQLPAEQRYLNVAGACVAAILERQPALSEPEVLTYNVQLALQEACTNIVEHAYSRQPGAIIDVTFKLLPEPPRLVIDLYDTGRPFNPNAVAAPNLDEMNEGGYGLFLMQELMDAIQYDSRPDGNHMQLTKNL